MKGQKIERWSWASENLYSVRAVMQFIAFLLACVQIQNVSMSVCVCVYKVPCVQGTDPLPPSTLLSLLLILHSPGSVLRGSVAL